MSENKCKICPEKKSLRLISESELRSSTFTQMDDSPKIKQFLVCEKTGLGRIRPTSLCLKLYLTSTPDALNGWLNLYLL